MEDMRCECHCPAWAHNAYSGCRFCSCSKDKIGVFYSALTQAYADLREADRVIESCDRYTEITYLSHADITAWREKTADAAWRKQ